MHWAVSTENRLRGQVQQGHFLAVAHKVCVLGCGAGGGSAHAARADAARRYEHSVWQMVRLAWPAGLQCVGRAVAVRQGAWLARVAASAMGGGMVSPRRVWPGHIHPR